MPRRRNNRMSKTLFGSGNSNPMPTRDIRSKSRPAWSSISNQQACEAAERNGNVDADAKPWKAAGGRGCGRRDAEAFAGAIPAASARTGTGCRESEFARCWSRGRNRLAGGMGKIGSSGRKIRRRGGFVLEVAASQPAGPDERCGSCRTFLAAILAGIVGFSVSHA